MFQWRFACLTCCVFVFNREFSGAAAREEDVLWLDDATFGAAINGNPFILVEFYAPWCGHCKQFAPEYSDAATQLKHSSPPVALAKIDAVAEPGIAARYNVRGYPTIRLFVSGKDQEYTGGRTTKAVVEWVLKKVGAVPTILPDVEAAEAFVQSSGLTVVGFFGDAVSRVAFDSAARQFDDVAFASTSEPGIIAKYAAVPPMLRMFFPHDERSADFSGDMQNSTDIELFVKMFRQPAVSIFNSDTSPNLFNDGRPIMLLFRDKSSEQGQVAERDMRAAASSLQRRVLVAIAGSREPIDQRLMDYMVVAAEELPTVRLVANPMAGMVKYKLNGEISASSIAEFVSDYERGRLAPHFKSQDPPTSQEGPVYSLVGSSFESVVKNPAKDVLVLFYAPWCGHCRKLEPVYASVAQKLQTSRSLTIAKIDATANDVLGVDIQGFPTIMFWPADKKEKPLDYDSDRDVESFIAWLEDKATHPLRLNEVRSEL